MKRAFISAAGFAMLLATLTAGFLPALPAAQNDARDGEAVAIGTYRQLHSRILDEDRLLLVCPPPNYDESSFPFPAGSRRADADDGRAYERRTPVIHVSPDNVL